MNNLGNLLKSLRGKRSLRYISKLTGLSHSYLSMLENGFDPRTKTPIKPSFDTLKRLSNAYNYPYEQLLKTAGYIEGKSDIKDSNQNELTEKDEKDIAKRMEKLRKDLLEGKNTDGLSFHGEPMSEEAIESLLSAIEHAERIATLANKKYIPKKYRNDSKA